MTNTTTSATEDLRQQHKAAQQRQRDLIQEHASIDQEIQEAARTAAKEKAAAARAGESMAVAADLDVEHLRRRLDELPWEIYGARITSAQLARDLHQAELEEATAESRKASEAFAAAQEKAREAEAIRDRAFARHSAAGAKVNRARGQIREAGRTLEQLEEAPPRV